MEKEGLLSDANPWVVMPVCVLQAEQRRGNFETRILELEALLEKKSQDLTVVSNVNGFLGIISKAILLQMCFACTAWYKNCKVSSWALLQMCFACTVWYKNCKDDKYSLFLFPFVDL